MKIGIYSGEIPPPIFIINLVVGLSEKQNKIFIYGKPIVKKYKFPDSNIIQRKVPLIKINLIINSIIFFIRLLIKQPFNFFYLFKHIYKNSNSWMQFFNRSCRVLPPILDELDIFHIQWAKALVEYPEFIQKMQCPIVLSLRGAHINYSPLADKELANKFRKYFPKVSAFHAVSDAIAKESIKYSVDYRKITIIHPAVKEKLINSKTKLNKQDRLLNIISVGRCHWKKGYTFALDAMAELSKSSFEFQYTIIASGKDQEYLLYQINDYNLNNCVHFINGLPHEEIIKRVSQSSLFLLPSVEEGISNAALESMAVGTPVISTDCGGMREVISNSKNGFLIPVRDPDAIAKTIKYYYKLDYVIKKKIISNARETIYQNHLLSNQINQFQNLFNDIYKNKK